MAPKEKKESTSGFTARDLDLIAAAIQSTKAPVEVQTLILDISPDPLPIPFTLSLPFVEHLTNQQALS